MRDKISETYSTSEEHKRIVKALRGQVGVGNPRILLTRQASSEHLSNCHLFTDDVAHSARYSYDNYYLLFVLLALQPVVVVFFTGR
jgi:hypothetical protein